MLVDTHCHLYFDELIKDIDGVLNRADKLGVKTFICVGTDLNDSIKSFKLAQQYENIYSTAGIHPHNAEAAENNYINKLREILVNKKIVAVGEMGLDYYRNISNPDSQKLVFKEQLNLGFIGTGLRGQWVLWLVAKYPEVNIHSICDIDDEMISNALKILNDAGKPEPKIYNNGDEDFLNLVNRDDLNAVIIATPWEWHQPMAVAAMKQGKHVGVEVPAAITVEECWDLINTSEKTGKECMIMENVCYYKDTMAILNMVRKEDTLSDFYLAGKGLGLGILFLTLFRSLFSLHFTNTN